MVACPPNVRLTSTSWGLSYVVSIFRLKSFNRDDLVSRLWEEKVRLWSLECLLITEIIWSWTLRSVQCCDRMLSRSSWNWVFPGIGATKSNGSSDSFDGIKDVSTMPAWYDSWLVTSWFVVLRSISMPSLGSSHRMLLLVVGLAPRTYNKSLLWFGLHMVYTLGWILAFPDQKQKQIDTRIMK